MATLREDAGWFEPPLFGDDRLKAEVRFNQYSGWEWIVQHRTAGIWYILDSGSTSSWNEGLHRVQKVIGELDSPLVD